MKYSKEEFLKEVLDRGKSIAREKRQKQFRKLSAATLVLSVALLGAITTCVRIDAGNQTKTVYGSFLLSPQAGGYFLVAFVSFALGFTVTLLIQKCQKMKDEKSETSKDKDQKGV